MAMTLHEGERDLLAAVVANLRDDNVKLVYADWLEDRGDDRGVFLREFVEASRVMRFANLPKPDHFSEEWLELVGFRLVQTIAELGGDAKVRDQLLSLARPAIKITCQSIEQTDEDLPPATSKYGGLPDLPAGATWPMAEDCAPITEPPEVYPNSSVVFLAQINFADISETQVVRSLSLPTIGLLSFFCRINKLDDGVIVNGLRTIFSPDTSNLVRQPRLETPPGAVGTASLREEERLTFSETLDIPTETSDLDEAPRLKGVPEAILAHYRHDHSEILFGCGRSGSADKTPPPNVRHLLLVRYLAEWNFHLQIAEAELLTQNFNAVEHYYSDDME